MPCVLLLLLMMGPRMVIFLTWLFSSYLNRAYDSNFWPFMGFLFMPYTVIGYAIARNNLGGVDGGIGLIVVVLAVLLDLGVIGGGASKTRNATSAGSRRDDDIDPDGLKRVN